MDQAQILLNGLWEPFSFLPLFGYASLGLLLGGVAGLLLVLQLQRRGWLARQRRWHHWLLKLYFLLLPLGGAFLGVQGGLLYGGQQQVNKHLDTYAPLLQVVADGVWQGFSGYLQEQDQQALLDELQASSVQQLLNHLAAQYLQEQLLARPAELEDASWTERISLSLLDHLQVALLGELVRDTAIEQANKYTGVDRKVMLQVLDARVEQLFQADFLVGLFKRQISQVLKPFYLSLLALAVLLLVLVGLELGVSRWLRQWRAQASAQTQVQQGEGLVGAVQR
ncbi:hypothetical protein [Pseudomonas sp. Gutcm_11s]|uniref:hypothetical protein n=1 Tax=Pseudomonas sp. Gutcm_11s TaxID=3026088 RepID=UPI00235F5942|nr:hypothetical protein [Pseudomonas sp. Gutcm_11s]MDD0843045.1 hypothetical protein [Pseudomonas sp. Gutcm_11s]